MGRDVGVVVPAAGDGARLKRGVRKAFVPLNGQPLVWHALRVLQATPVISVIVIAAHAEDQRRMQRLVRRARLTKVTAIIAGGASRAESVARGIAALPSSVQWVVVHDGARPCVTSALVTQIIQHAKRYGAAACGLPMSLTVKAVDQAGVVRMTLDRESLWAVQTPQAFRRIWFQEAWQRVTQEGVKPASPALGERFPDDVSVLEWAGFPVRMVPGQAWNVKVTRPEDLTLARAILHARNGRA